MFIGPCFLPVKNFRAYWSLWEISIQSGGGAGCGFCSFSCWLNRVGASRECGMGGWLVGWVGLGILLLPGRCSSSPQPPPATPPATGSGVEVGSGRRTTSTPSQPFSSYENYGIRRTNNSAAVKVVLYLVVFVGLVKCQLTISLPRCLFNCHIETKSNGRMKMTKHTNIPNQNRGGGNWHSDEKDLKSDKKKF